MRITSHKPNVAEVDMTPMIDIVFQLIAFFMLVTNFENVKADERVKLPEHVLAKPPEVKREKELFLNIGFIRDSTGAKQSEALLFYAGEEVPMTDFARLSKILNRENRIYTDLNVDPKNVTVVIRADKEVPTGLVQELIRLCQQQNFEKFALKATQEQSP